MAQSMMRKIAMGNMFVLVGLTRRTSSRSLVTGGKNLASKKVRNELPPEREVTKSVFMSQSTDIYTNLALEDWMYRNMDFSNHHVMMVWRNEPCVVIGRHQNPWLEANVPYLSEKEIALARRNSGGGTVYHDRGNLNITFFTPRERHDRKYNLELIKRALYRGFGIKSVINDRHDIIVQDKYKVSFFSKKTVLGIRLEKFIQGKIQMVVWPNEVISFFNFYFGANIEIVKKSRGSIEKLHKVFDT